MSGSGHWRRCRPCAYPLPVGKNTISFQYHGTYKGIFLKVVEDTWKLRFRLATGPRRFFGKPIARRVGHLLHRETRRASSNDHLRGRISVISQALPGGLRRTICLGLAQPLKRTHLQCASLWGQVPWASPKAVFKRSVAAEDSGANALAA